MIPDTSERPAMTVTEAARALGISRTAGYAAVADGSLPHARLGKRRIVIPTAAVRRMLELDGEPEERAAA